jgi:hypothetical protein
VQKDAWTELDLVEKRIRQQETDVERMKDEYHREVLHLRNLLKQKEIIIGRLQHEKMYVKTSLYLKCYCFSYPDSDYLNLIIIIIISGTAALTDASCHEHSSIA